MPRASEGSREFVVGLAGDPFHFDADAPVGEPIVDGRLVNRSHAVERPTEIALNKRASHALLRCLAVLGAALNHNPVILRASRLRPPASYCGSRWDSGLLNLINTLILTSAVRIRDR